MLLAEEYALLAIRPDTGRHALGTRSQLNACLAGLLLAELVLDGTAQLGHQRGTLVLTAGPIPRSRPLAAAAQVAAQKGPKIKPILSHLDRGLRDQLGHGTWDTLTAGLTHAGLLQPRTDGRRGGHSLVGSGVRADIIARLSAAATSDGPLDPRTALVLSMTGPAHLLEVVAPHRGDRRHARRRIDHSLDGSPFEPLARAVRRLIADAQATAGFVAGT
jgi:hypothetical protein